MEEKYEWYLELWKNINNKSFVQDFFEEIRNKDQVLFTQISKKINYLKNKRISDLQKTEILKIVKSHTELYEFRIRVEQEVRMLGVLIIENIRVPTFYALHAFIKKDQKIMKKEIKTAIIRLEEFKK